MKIVRVLLVTPIFFISFLLPVTGLTQHQDKDTTKTMKLKIIAYSDNICPYCYVGAKRINKLKQEIDFDIEWKAFEIHPETPKEGIPLQDYFKNFKITAAKKYLERFGKDVGIKMNSKVLSNSHLSLKANEFAKGRNKLTGFHDAIFVAYFEEGKDIGNIDVILEVAESVGLEKEELKAYLQTDESDKIIQVSSNQAMEYGITGVPTFIIGDKMIVGAQSYKALKKAVLKARSEM